MTDFLIVLNKHSVSLPRPSDIARVWREANIHSPAGNCRGPHPHGLTPADVLLGIIYGCWIHYPGREP